MGAIFLSYRRSDTACETGRVFDRLCEHYGRHNTFIDIGDIPAGRDFRARIRRAIEMSEVVLVIIGPTWLSATDASGQPRLGKVDDPVTEEIQQSLALDVCVIPVLVDGASMPDENDLPEVLRPFASRNAFALSTERFHSDMDPLIKVAEQQAVGLKENAFVRLRFGKISRRGIEDVLVFLPQAIERLHRLRKQNSWRFLVAGFFLWLGVIALGVAVIENHGSVFPDALSRHNWIFPSLAMAATGAMVHCFFLMRQTLCVTHQRKAQNRLSGEAV